MQGQLAEGREKVQPILGNIRRMNADDGVNCRKTLGKRDGVATALQARADRDDACDAGLGGPGNDPLKIGLKVRIVEMGVCLDQIHGEKAERIFKQEIRKAGKMQKSPRRIINEKRGIWVSSNS